MSRAWNPGHPKDFKPPHKSLTDPRDERILTLDTAGRSWESAIWEMSDKELATGRDEMRRIPVIVIFGIAFAATGACQAEEGFEETLKSLMAKSSEAPIAARIHDFDAFARGRIGGIGVGSTMNEVVRKWGKPVDMQSGHGGRTWRHYYGNAAVKYHNSKLEEITVGRKGEMDCRFTNGLSGTLNRDGVVKILSEPTRTNHAGMWYQIGDNIISITFLLERQFPKNAAEWEKARVATISISHRAPRQAANVHQPRMGYQGMLHSLLKDGAVAPTGGGTHDFSAFRQGRLMGISLRDSMSDVVRRWGKPVDMSSTHEGRIWTHYYENAALLYHDHRLVRISLGRMGRLDCRFTNGLSAMLIQDEAVRILGAPKDRSPAMLKYRSGDCTTKLIFDVNGIFRDDAAECSERLGAVSVECASSVD